VIDPFSDEADPVRLDGSRAPVVPEHSAAQVLEKRVARRSLMLALAVLPAVCSVSGCLQLAPACSTRAADPLRCTQRFCRYYGDKRGDYR